MDRSTTDRTTVESGTEWESVAGYSRAVRVGSHVSVSGTTATDENGEIVRGDAYEQAARAISNVERALREAGAELADVVRTRIFVTDIDEWDRVASAHAEAFGDIRPATTMVEVGGLIAPELVVEIEADAIVSDGTAVDVDDESDSNAAGDGTDGD